MPRLAPAPVLLLALAALALPSGAARAQSHVWTGTGGAGCLGLGFGQFAWECPLNWSAGTVPTATDDVLISGNPFISGNLTSGAVNSLTLSGTPNVQPAGSLTVGALVWNGGTLKIGGTITLVGQGVITGGGLLWESTLLVASGATLTWVAGQLSFNHATFANGGTVDLQGDGRAFHCSQVPCDYVQDGLAVLKRTGGEGQVNINVSVTNDHGAIVVESGMLAFQRGGRFEGGGYDALDGAALLFDFGTFTFADSLAGNPSGFIGSDVSATLSFPEAAVFDFGMAGFQWTGGMITGAGALRNKNRLRVTNAGFEKTLSNGTIRNEATMEWDGGRIVFLGVSQIQNFGLFDLLADGQALHNMADGPREFRNLPSGTLRKRLSAGTTSINLPITNDGGRLEADTGTLSFVRSSALIGGTYDASDGAVLVFDTGTFTLSGTLTGAPAGFVGCDVTMAIPEATTATLDFGGTGFQWINGTLTRAGVGTGLLVNAGLLVITGAANKSLSNVVLRNTGTVRWDGGRVNFTNGRVENAGLFDLTADGVALNFSSGTHAFTNEAGGLLRKSAGAGTTTMGVNVTNHFGAAIDAATGTLDFTRTLDHQFGARIQGNGVVKVPPGGSLTNGGVTAPGASPGLLTWVGAWAPRVAGALEVELGGLAPGTEHDRLAVSGTASLGGLLKVSFTDGYTPDVGDSFTILTASTVSGTFAVVEEPPGWSFDVAYDATSVVITAQAEEVVTATLVPQTGPPDGPVVIPPGGGQVRYRARLRNTTGQAQTMQAWIEALLPNGSVYQGSPLVGPVTQTLNPGQTLGPVSLAQAVPGSIPAGAYVIRLRVGQYPSVVVDEDAFVVVKEEGPPGLAAAEAPASAGAASAEAASAEAASAGEALPAAFALHAASPNPFSARATLRYDLPEAAHVRLAVYDLLGREVAVLVDAEAEAGRHEVVLEGRSLAAGVYVVRLAAGVEAFTQRLTRVR